MNGTGTLLHGLARALRAGIRLVGLRPVSRADVVPSAELFACLIAFDVLLMFVFSVAAFGLDGTFNPYEIPRTLMFVPLVLAAGLFAHRLDRGADVLLLPVAFAAASIVMTTITSVMYILAQHQLIPFVESYWYAFDYVVLSWAAVIVLVGAWRLLGGSALVRAAAGVVAVALIILPQFLMPQGMLWMPPYDETAGDATRSFHTLAQESAFYAQQGALERELDGLQPERPGVADLYVVAAGLYAGEDVFLKEVRMITDLLRQRFDANGRIVTLINNVQTLAEFPIASLTSIRQSLQQVGEVINPEEDVVVLYLSSHGSENHELSVDFRPLRFTGIDPVRLKAALDQSRIRWKVIVISACYSGGFVDALKDERTLIITASSADRMSFGCGSGSDATYLAKALFGEALKKTHSFETAFGEARTLIEQWEQQQGYTPSQPQIHVGARIRPKLAQIERRLNALAAPAR